MKQWGLILMGCLLLPAAAPAGDGNSETISPKELRGLLKGEKNAAGPAGELVFSMSPEEKAKLLALFQTDRDAARKMILEKLEENKQRRAETARKIRETTKKFRTSRDETEKTELRNELRTLLTEQFERTTAEIAVRLKLQEQRLAVVRRAYEERREKSEQMIEAQLEKITRKHPPVDKKRQDGKKRDRKQQEKATVSEQ